MLRIDPDELERLAEQREVPARRIGSSWRFNRTALMAWLNGDWEPIDAAVTPRAADLSSSVLPDAPPPESRSSLTTQDMTEVTATGTAIGQAETTPSASAPPPAEGQDGPIGEAPEERTAEDVFLRGQRVLLGRGEVVMDFGQFYSRSVTQQLVSVDGGLGLATLEQETFTTLVLGRVGIMDETEVFASTTFSSQGNDAFLGTINLANIGRTELGDIGVGVRHTLLLEGAGRPDIIATINGRIPTGDSSYGIGGGLILVKSVDPVVLFASANYNYGFSRDLSDATRLEPGNQFNVSMGYGLGLNDTLAIITAVSGLFEGATTFDNATLRQTDSFSLRFALTSWLAEGLYIEPSVSFGLSAPGNSFALGLTIPYSF